MSEIFDMISVLSDRVATTYRLIQRLDPHPASLADYCPDGASRWVAQAAIDGRTLPVNAATVQALRYAATRLDEVLAGTTATA